MNDFNIGDRVKCGGYHFTIVERLNPELDTQYNDSYYRLERRGDKNIYRWGSTLTKIKPSLFDRILIWFNIR